ncbi:CBS domain containing-hemolysin-like protein [Glutamicibacter mysorens]|uniref:CBS domain containing-hemolysin-like protein n=1 Tax=Glutamicibacter mysorens TaxID=257984 RepID=A0ABX4MX09_9MICC|nr:hemolysin family protein [Glutamicibacter mysorens]PJJ43867.1 CBS domain containing-hemolysin-like protein [Glutamicibacter mysorens]
MEIVLLVLALVFMAFSAVLTAVDSAFYALSRHAAERLRAESNSKALSAILDEAESHAQAVKFWRIWFETASAVAVALLVSQWIANVWLIGMISTIAMAALGFVLVSVSPRRYGRSNAQTVVQSTATLVRFLRLVLGPVTNWLASIAKALSPGGADGEGYLGKERLRDLVDRASEGEDLDEESAELISSVIDLEETSVRSVMVPRTDMVVLDADHSFHSAMDLFIASGFSRIPLIGEDTDDIQGIIYLKDLIREIHGLQQAQSLADLARKVRFVPESKSAAELMQELQQESIHLAVVIDEYGGTAGLVTLEDLLEEIVGEIDDEYDRSRAELIENPDGSIFAVAAASIDDVADHFGMHIEEEDVDTVAGLLSKALESVPVLGSTADVHGLRLTVVALAGRRNRIGKIHVERLETDASDHIENDEDSSDE